MVVVDLTDLKHWRWKTTEHNYSEPNWNTTGFAICELAEHARPIDTCSLMFHHEPSVSSPSSSTPPAPLPTTPLMIYLSLVNRTLLMWWRSSSRYTPQSAHPRTHEVAKNIVMKTAF